VGVGGSVNVLDDENRLDGEKCSEDEKAFDGEKGNEAENGEEGTAKGAGVFVCAELGSGSQITRHESGALCSIKSGVTRPTGFGSVERTEF
jgi:hypothetical protein